MTAASAEENHEYVNPTPWIWPEGLRQKHGQLWRATDTFTIRQVTEENVGLPPARLAC